MKTIKASTNRYAMLVWIIIIAILTVLSFYFDKKIIYIIPAFINVVGQVILNRATKYQLSNEVLIVKIPFQRIEIELDKVRSYNIKQPGFFKKIMLGYPQDVIALIYNRFDDIEILSTDKLLEDNLLNIVNPVEEVVLS